MIFSLVPSQSLLFQEMSHDIVSTNHTKRGYLTPSAPCAINSNFEESNLYFVGNSSGVSFSSSIKPNPQANKKLKLCNKQVTNHTIKTTPSLPTPAVSPKNSTQFFETPSTLHLIPPPNFHDLE